MRYYDTPAYSETTVTCGTATVEFAQHNMAGRLSYVYEHDDRDYTTTRTFFSYTIFGELEAVYQQTGDAFDFCGLRGSRYEYDGIGRLAVMTYPSGRRVSLTYVSGASVPSTLEVRAPTIDNPPLMTATLTFTEPGVLAAAEAGLVRLETERDLNGGLIQKDWRVNGTSSLTIRLDTRDPNGNIRVLKDMASGRQSTFTYDAIERLQSVSAPGFRGNQQSSYVYDQAGNRTSETSFGKTITYNLETGGNQLESMSWPGRVNQTCGVVDAPIAWDAAGRATTTYPQKFPLPTEAVGLSYDLSGRVERATVGVQDYRYVYDHDSLRVLKVAPDLNPTRFTYSGGQLISEENAGDTLEIAYVGGRPLFALSTVNGQPPQALFVASDHIGAPQRLYDVGTGKVLWAADYEPFGRAWEYLPSSRLQPSIALNIRLPGQYLDRETGLHYNWHRYYDPDTGRYLQPDPLLSDPTMLRMFTVGARRGWLNAPYGAPFIDAYAYAVNNPLKYTDATGLSPWVENCEEGCMRKWNDCQYRCHPPLEPIPKCEKNNEFDDCQKKCDNEYESCFAGCGRVSR